MSAQFFNMGEALTTPHRIENNYQMATSMLGDDFHKKRRRSSLAFTERS